MKNHADALDSVIESDKKQKKRNKRQLISRIVLIVSACVFLYAAYNLITILLEYKKGNDIYNSIEEQVLDDNKPSVFKISSHNYNEEDEPEEIEGKEVEIPFTYDHESLLAINPEGIGFLYIPSLDLRLPMAQTTDNDYYLTHTFDRTYNTNGCLFLDSRIKGGIDASHLIIHGHCLNSGAMFSHLFKYKSYWFWATEGNDVFYIYTGNVLREYRIFTVYVSDPISDTYTYNFPNLEQLREYAASMQSKSLYNTGVDISNATQICTFSTCTNNTTQRLIVQGTLIGECKLNEDNE